MRIELHEVRKRYGPALALDGVTLEIPSGARLALVGPNGSGKSTLLRALLGLVACEGRVLLDGRSPFDERDAVAGRLAYVPQVAPQLGASVGEVVAAVRDLRGTDDGRVAALCTALGLELGPVAGKPFRGLSGGMKQKLLLALALASRPELLVLDEPTASLDAAARERLFALLREQAPACTLVLCSHRLEEVRALVGSVAALADGRLAWSGPVEEYLADRALSLVEVRAEAERSAWLLEHGFLPGAAGCWHRTVAHRERPRLLAALREALGSTLLALDVRDLERLDIPGGENA